MISALELAANAAIIALVTPPAYCAWHESYQPGSTQRICADCLQRYFTKGAHHAERQSQGAHLMIEAPKDIAIARAELVPGTPEYSAKQQQEREKTQGGMELR